MSSLLSKNYIKEIDSLRAIAVIGVVLYHIDIEVFNFQIFRGGFLGVDIFFVISGYLITKIILSTIDQTGSFSFILFWKRRIRRLLPTLLFVIFFFFLLALNIFNPNDLKDFSKAVLFTLTSISNFYFYETLIQYGSPNNIDIPFLHFWTLSLEFQFYFLFPILILISIRIFKKKFYLSIFILFFVSLIAAEYCTRNFQLLSFYLLPTRFWEFLMGSILVKYECKINKKYFSKNFLSIIGLLLIFFSFFYFEKETNHPSLSTLPISIGTGLIIWFADKNNFVSKFLRLKTISIIGLMSYSIYLWHYPLFSFSNFLGLLENNKLLLLIVLFFISYISYNLVEKKFRKRKMSFFNLIIFISILYSINFFLSIYLINHSTKIENNENENNLPKILIQEEVKPWNLLKNSNNEVCFENYCEFKSKSKKNVYLIGDSHMASISYDLKEKVILNGYNFFTSTKGNCIFFPGFNLEGPTKKDPGCNNIYFKNLEEKLLKEENSIIIFGGRWQLYLNESYFDNKEGFAEEKIYNKKYVAVDSMYSENFKSSFKNIVERLSKNNHVILLYPIPEVGVNVYNYLNQKFKFNDLSKNFFNNRDNFFTTSYVVQKHRMKKSYEFLDSINGDSISRFYPAELLCNEYIPNRCLTHNEEKIFYYDDNHLSIFGSRLINNSLIDIIVK